MIEKHTPGPWYIDEDMRPGMSWNRHIHSDRNTTICFMAHSDGKAEEMDEANARLVAAAPDLLEALKACQLELHYCSKQLESEGWTTGSTVTKALESGLVAIAKAEGGTASPQPPAEPAVEPPSLSPTAGMNIAQRILHVGGRNNAAGYVEFGSIQAVEALVRQVLRDLPPPPPAQPVVQHIPADDTEGGAA